MPFGLFATDFKTVGTCRVPMSNSYWVYELIIIGWIGYEYGVNHSTGRMESFWDMENTYHSVTVMMAF